MTTKPDIIDRACALRALISEARVLVPRQVPDLLAKIERMQGILDATHDEVIPELVAEVERLRSCLQHVDTLCDLRVRDLSEDTRQAMRQEIASWRQGIMDYRPLDGARPQATDQSPQGNDARATMIRADQTLMAGQMDAIYEEAEMIARRLEGEGEPQILGDLLAGLARLVARLALQVAVGVARGTSDLQEAGGRTAA